MHPQPRNLLRTLYKYEHMSASWTSRRRSNCCDSVSSRCLGPRWQSMPCSSKVTRVGKVSGKAFRCSYHCSAARHAETLWFWSSSKLSFLGVSHRFAEPPFVQVSCQTLFIALNVLFRDWNILLGVEPRSPRKPCFGIAKSLPFYKVTRAFHKTFIQTCCHGKCTRHDMQHHATNHPRTFQDWLFGWLIGWLMWGRNNKSSQDKKNPMPSVDEIDSCNVQPGSSTTTNGTINEACFSG